MADFREVKRLKEAKIGGFLDATVLQLWFTSNLLRPPGEGTYAVVYRGQSLSPRSPPPPHHLPVVPAREKTTGRRVAIKKIKVGQFKDGLDMSAIREVKYLRELSHPNVIEVWKKCIRTRLG